MAQLPRFIISFSYITIVRYVVCMTGCSGIAYGVRLLEELEGEKILVMSKTAEKLIEFEMDIPVKEVCKKADIVFDDDDFFASIASGSYHFDALIVVPCSASTLAKVSQGIADNLITRSAAVALKQQRKLIIVPRETPLSAIMIENELKLAKLGVCILPANPGFYHSPMNVDDIIDFVVGKILDQLGQEHDLYNKWE